MRKILCVVLAFVICSFTLFSAVRAEEIDDLQTQQQELQNQLNDANGELEGVQSDLSENLQQVQKLDEKISNSQTELTELNKKITELQSTIDEVEEKLKVAEDKYYKQKDIAEQRLVAIYEEGETQYLDVVLTSRSISDFLSNYFLVTELATYDAEILEDLERQKKEIEDDKKKLDNSKEELATIKTNQTRTAKILENTKSVRENFISRLTQEEKNIQADIQ